MSKQELHVSINQRCTEEDCRLQHRDQNILRRLFNEAVHILGHAYAEALVLISGPVATPDYTACLIEWTVNTPAYHRVRYKKPGGGWTVTAWTVTPSTNATINLTGL